MASCRTMRDAPLPALGPELASLSHADAALRPIRVGVRAGVEQAVIAAPGGVSVRGAAVGENVALVRSLPSATFLASAHAGRIRLLETGDELERALVEPADASAQLTVDRAPYRGVMEVLPAEESRITVVNVVALEAYLRGVVPNELSPEAFPQLEAQKAQAVAARSYVLAHLGDYSSRGYDVCASAACQVYRGPLPSTRHPTERWRRRAEGRPGAAGRSYTSTCGGHTEEGTAVSRRRAVPARCRLRDRACARRRSADGREWEVRLRPADVARAVARYGSVGRVLDLVPTKVGVSGRVVELRVVGSEGELDLRGQRVRLGLGLRESLFVLHRESAPQGDVERFVFTGKGWGHGVGLCQVGASGMARAGAKFEDILKHYYTGVAVTSLATPLT
jgi:stage II sporulation protein D